jgi:hypothetical protein
MKSNLVVSYLFLASFLVGCGATIQTYERLHQPTASDLSTYIGGTVFKVERTSDLPNAFGKADIFGGKVTRGFTELRYQGLTPDKKPIFRVTEVDTQSSETTMSRYGGGTSTINTTTSHSGYGSQTYGTVIHQPAPHGKTEMLPPNTTEFVIDPAKTKELNIAGVRVEILGFDEHSLRYRLTK